MAKITSNPTVDYSTDQPAKLYYLDDSIAILPCVGSPEGAIAADRGSIASDITTGNLYAKTTNTLATGWNLVGSGGGGGITGSGTSGQVTYFNGATSVTSESGFAWNTASKSLSLSGVAPNLTVTDGASTPTISILNTNNLSIRSVSTITDPQLILHRVRASGTYPQNNDIIGSIVWFSSDAVGLDNPAKLIVTATQNHSASVAGSSVLLEASLNGSTTRTQRILCDGVGNVVTGLPSLAQAATAGFTYIPSIANTPSGVPSSLPTGFVPLAVDVTNFRLYGYASGAWKNLTGSGGGGSPAGVTGDYQINNAGAFGAGVIAQGTNGRVIIAPTAITSGSVNYYQINIPADTNQTASVENNGIRIVTATRQWLVGNITTQREIQIEAPTYSFTAASTITTAATLAITNAPIAGTNATLTNKYSLFCQAGYARFDGGVTSSLNNGSEQFGLGSSSSAGQLNTAVGASATIGGDGSVAVGYASNSWTFGVAIGQNALSTAGTTSGIAIGRSANAAGNYSVAIGYSAVANANNFVCGSDVHVTNNVYFGKGETSSAPTNYAINGTGGSGTDITAGDVNIAAGKGTGAGSPGNINLQFARPSATGSTLNTISERYFFFYSTDKLSQQVELKSSTTALVPATLIENSWVVNTHASRTTRMTLNCLDFGGTRECLRAQSSGTAAMIGFLGAVAVVRQTGGALTAGGTYTANEQSMLNKVYAAMQAYGLLT